MIRPNTKRIIPILIEYIYLSIINKLLIKKINMTNY